MGSSYRRKWAVTAALVSGGAILLGLILVRQPFVRTARAEQEREEKYLFVWTGDQARTKPDFLAVIDFDKESNRYESVVTTVRCPVLAQPGMSRIISVCPPMGKSWGPAGY